MTLKEMIAAWGAMAILVLLINAGIIVGVIWLVVKVLRYLGVIDA